MNTLTTIINYVRRIVKTPSNTSLSSGVILDYINRFWINDIDPRIQTFDLKKTYQFVTRPGFDKYNIPYYAQQVENPGLEFQTIEPYPKYQGFLAPCTINGVELNFQTQHSLFNNIWPDRVQYMPAIEQGTGSSGTTYNLQAPLVDPNQSQFAPYNTVLLRGHLDTYSSTSDTPRYSIPGSLSVDAKSLISQVFISSQDSKFNPVVLVDSGMFDDTNLNKSALVVKSYDSNSYNSPSGPANLNFVNYITGQIVFKGVEMSGPINLQVSYAQTGMPRAVLFYDNYLTLRPCPDSFYTVNIDAYLTPSAFLTTTESTLKYGYMAEYIARGAARKILSDTGDIEQFNFYEPLFREQEILVWKRSQRQWTSTRTQTLYSQGPALGIGNSYIGGAY